MKTTVPAAMTLFAFCLSMYASPARAEQEFNVTAPVKVKLGASVQADYFEAVNVAGGFRIKRARLRLTAVSPEVPQASMRLQTEFVASPALLDLVIDWADQRGLPDWLKWKASVGQFKPPFSREHLANDDLIPTLNRTNVVEALAPGRDTASRGREPGAMLEVSASPWGRGDWLVARAGAFNGEGTAAAGSTDKNDQKDFVGRLEWAPYSFLSLGGSTVQGRLGSPRRIKQRNGWDIEARYGPATVTFEYLFGRTADKRAKGAYAQAVVWVWKEEVQAVYRWDWFDPDLGAGSDRVYTTTLGLNWYPAKVVRLTFNQELKREEGPRISNDTSTLSAQYFF
jgi:hypothetical protein